MAYVGRFDGTNAKHASPAMAAASGAQTSSEDITALPTSTKWSVLSSRIEGLAMEMCQVVGGMDAYCVSMSNAEGPAMRAVRAKMLATDWKEEWEKGRTMFSYGEEMSTDPLEAMMLKQFVHMARPKRVLEVGMFVGFGAVAMMEGSPKTRVVSLEIDPFLQNWLAECLAEFPGMRERHEVVVGAALDSLPKLTGQFDMVFVDANKSEYKRYVELMLERDLIAPGGTIICDNVLYNGYPYLSSHFDAQPARRAFGDDIKVFNKWVCDHGELEQVVLPIRDGVSILRKRTSSPSISSVASFIKDYYTFAPAPAALIVDVFLREKGVSAEGIKAIQRDVDLPNFENRGEVCKAMNPQGSIPWFVTPEGAVIAETIAMCEFVEENLPQPVLVGASATERAVTRMWQRRLEEHFCSPATYAHRNWCHSEDCPSDHPMKNFYSKRFNAEQGSNLLYSAPGAWKDLMAWARHRVAWLETTKRDEAVRIGATEPSAFICGDELSIVDIQVYVNMWYWDTFCPGQHFFEALDAQVPWVQEWYKRMHSRPSIVDARTAAGYGNHADGSDKEAK